MAEVENIGEPKSNLPHGIAFPIGDQGLWDWCVKNSPIGDCMLYYANVRGISREDARAETWINRYGGKGKSLMFDDELDEGMRMTHKLMAQENISYEAARAKIISDSANGRERSLQRELYDARAVLVLRRKHRDQLDADIQYTVNLINEIKRAALATGETVV